MKIIPLKGSALALACMLLGALAMPSTAAIELGKTSGSIYFGTPSTPSPESPYLIGVFLEVNSPLHAVPGITVNPTSGLTTTEAGGTASFTLVLDSHPSADVTIAISSSNPAEGTISTSLLTFGNDWNTPQTVTITGVNDFVDDGDVGYTIITDPASSADTDYNGMDASDVSVTNIAPEPGALILNIAAVGTWATMSRRRIR